MAAAVEDAGELALIRRVRVSAVEILEAQLRSDEQRQVEERRNDSLTAVALVVVPLTAVLRDRR